MPSVYMSSSLSSSLEADRERCPTCCCRLRRACQCYRSTVARRPHLAGRRQRSGSAATAVGNGASRTAPTSCHRRCRRRQRPFCCCCICGSWPTAMSAFVLIPKLQDLICDIVRLERIVQTNRQRCLLACSCARTSTQHELMQCVFN
uniref:Uncharacterized protein n=1 Tax=Oryza sativa subsp. japonica TaxID=39947 RepID=Q67U12_ORYSJ|nr:hypothetical protein [Oryza sativa Japonica Group]BAD38359.1 hypothetical protein [Oryza sativa Japonica Group]